MFPIVLVAGLLIGISTPAYKEFSRHSNGNASYSISLATPCQTGKRPSGYALAPADFVVLKQRDFSGQAGPVCKDK